MAVLKDLIVHGNSSFINTTQFNTTKGGTIAADKGVFNKLIATDAEIGTLDVDELNANNLTANNATIMGLLDVKGDLHTNSWTNSNIATIQGNFYIAPTVKTGTSSNDTGVTIAAISNGSATNGYWTLTLSGTSILAVPNLESEAVGSEAASSYNSWSSGSLVMVTGSIKRNGITYPLGTLKGELSGAVSANGATITKITDNVNNNPSTLQEYGAGTYGFVEIQISLYKRKYSSSLYPLGILMSAQGRASKSFIDIYGGGNIIQEGTISGASTDYGGLALPNVRIGNLRGLPNVRSGNFTADDCLPTGWGIYTDNGYFKGTIVSDSGIIGGWTLATDKLYSGTHSDYNTNVNGIYLGKVSTDFYIAGGGRSDATAAAASGGRYTANDPMWYLKSNGDIKFGDLTYINNVLTVPAAYVKGTLDAETLRTNDIVIGDALTSIAEHATSIENNSLYNSALLNDLIKTVDFEKWVQNNGQFIQITDTGAEYDPNQVYYELNQNTQKYEIVELTDGDSVVGKYILDDVPKSIGNFLQSHVYLNGNGIIIQGDTIDSSVQIYNSGIIIQQDGIPVATFGTNIILGDEEKAHLTLSATELGFFDAGTKVGRIYYDETAKESIMYLSNSELKTSKLTSSLQIGSFVWKVVSDNRISLIYAG